MLDKLVSSIWILKQYLDGRPLGNLCHGLRYLCYLDASWHWTDSYICTTPCPGGFTLPLPCRCSYHVKCLETMHKWYWVWLALKNLMETNQLWLTSVSLRFSRPWVHIPVEVYLFFFFCPQLLSCWCYTLLLADEWISKCFNMNINCKWVAVWMELYGWSSSCYVVGSSHLTSLFLTLLFHVVPL